MRDLGRFISTFTEFSGFTIAADGVRCYGISWSQTREQAPIYTMGPPKEPKRSKQAIAGTLIAEEPLPDRVKLIKIAGDEEWNGQNVHTTVEIRSAIILRKEDQETEEGHMYIFCTDLDNVPVVIREGLNLERVKDEDQSDDKE